MASDDEIRRGLRALRTRSDVASTLTLIGETLGDACSEFTVADGVAIFKWAAPVTEIAADATRAERAARLVKTVQASERAEAVEKLAQATRVEQQKDDVAVRDDWPRLLRDIDDKAQHGKTLAAFVTRERVVKTFVERLAADGFTVVYEGTQLHVGWGEEGVDWCVKYHASRSATSTRCFLLEPKEKVTC
jgi:hypothetical protein